MYAHDNSSPGDFSDVDVDGKMDEREIIPNKYSYDSTSDNDFTNRDTREHTNSTSPPQYAPLEPSFRQESNNYNNDDNNISNNTIKLAPEDNPTKKRVIELQQSALGENKRLAELSNELQNRLAEYFRDQKIEEMREKDKSVTNQEQRFSKIMLQVQEWEHELQTIRSYYHHNVQDMKSKLQEKEAKGREVKESFIQFKREIAKEAENTRTGKKMSDKVISEYEQEELARDRKLERIRLKNIMLGNHLLNLEKNLQEKEKLKDGLHLIDFEQLKIENQTFNEKIEERNEELMKLRKKINNTVQVLTHLKEKLQFVQGENQELKKYLAQLESDVTANRDTLARMKQKRDFVRAENTNLKQASGLIGSIDLLYDFEDCVRKLERNTETLWQLKEKHNLLLEQILQYQTNTQPLTTPKDRISTASAPLSPKSPHSSSQMMKSARIVVSPLHPSRLPPI